MSLAEDAALLLRIVRRHPQVMRLNLNPLYPNEEWGFQAQKALEKLLKAQLVLRDQPAPRTHELLDLALLLNEQLPEDLLQQQVFALEARYEEARSRCRPPGRSCSPGWRGASPAWKRQCVLVGSSPVRCGRVRQIRHRSCHRHRGRAARCGA
jgi:HEPN domain-containing protein